MINLPCVKFCSCKARLLQEGTTNKISFNNEISHNHQPITQRRTLGSLKAERVMHGLSANYRKPKISRISKINKEK